MGRLSIDEQTSKILSPRENANFFILGPKVMRVKLVGSGTIVDGTIVFEIPDTVCSNDGFEA